MEDDCTHFIAFRDMNVVANDMDVRFNVVKYLFIDREVLSVNLVIGLVAVGFFFSASPIGTHYSKI